MVSIGSGLTCSKMGGVAGGVGGITGVRGGEDVLAGVAFMFTGVSTFSTLVLITGVFLGAGGVTGVVKEVLEGEGDFFAGVETGFVMAEGDEDFLKEVGFLAGVLEGVVFLAGVESGVVEGEDFKEFFWSGVEDFFEGSRNFLEE